MPVPAYSPLMTVATLISEARERAELTQTQLATRAGTSQAAVARYESGRVSPSMATLERLVRAAGAELILKTVPAPVSNISGNRARKLRRHRQEILRLTRSVGVSNVRLFGSVARGDDSEESDIDLLVDFDVLLPIIELSAKLTTLLGENVDIAPVAMLRPKVAANALAEAVPL
jgi:predicted nucleotidyltransferase/DNA-binding XRE family transcriptional regulator